MSDKRAIAISGIAGIMVLAMVLGVVYFDDASAQPPPPIDSNKVKPHDSNHKAGIPPVDCALNGQPGMIGKLWFADINNNDQHDVFGPQDRDEPTMCLRPTSLEV